MACCFLPSLPSVTELLAGNLLSLCKAGWSSICSLKTPRAAGNKAVFLNMKSIRQVHQGFCVASILSSKRVTGSCGEGLGVPNNKLVQGILEGSTIVLCLLSFLWSLAWLLQAGPMLWENSDHSTSEAMSKSSGELRNICESNCCDSFWKVTECIPLTPCHSLFCWLTSKQAWDSAAPFHTRPSLFALCFPPFLSTSKLWSLWQHFARGNCC